MTGERGDHPAAVPAPGASQRRILVLLKRGGEQSVGDPAAELDARRGPRLPLPAAMPEGTEP